MSNSAVAERGAPPRELTAAEQPQQLITIDPKKYVELVFEPFVRQFEEVKNSLRKVSYDIKTTTGMSVAVKCRAAARDIRTSSERTRKRRKAPILEIGKLLDSSQNDLEAMLLPLETFFDEEIKGEEARKEAEKQAKFAAEQARVAAIRARIDEIRSTPANMVGKSSEAIGLAATHLSESIIDLGEYAELTGEAAVERNNTVTRLREMQAAQLAHEQAVAEAARQAEADRVERERVAEANRVEAKRLADLAAEMEREAQAARAKQAEADRIAAEQREAAEREQQAAEERVAAAMHQQQAEHEARMAAEREAANAAWLAQHEAEQASLRVQQEAADKLAAAMSEIQGIQQQVIIATQGRLGVRNGGTLECLRETLSETEAWEIDAERFGILAGAAESAKTTAAAEIRRLLAQGEARVAAEDAEKLDADYVEALEENERIDVVREAASEAARIEADRIAALAEAERRKHVQFELNGPAPTEMVAVLAKHYDVTTATVEGWMCRHVWAELGKAA